MICTEEPVIAVNNFRPRCKPWDSLALLQDITRSTIALTDSELAPHVELLEYDMNTEYDSQHFCTHLRKLESDGMIFSPEFVSFEKAWRQDEWNHYIGYRKLYSVCTGEPESVLHDKVVSREVDFSEISHFLQDEFGICVVLAYDEIFTAKSCKLDFELFESFGPSRLSRWIKKVARDECFHFLNVIDVIRVRHRDRIPEAPQLLNKLIEWDHSHHGSYSATFILDHSADRSGSQILESCKKAVLHCLKIPKCLSSTRRESFLPIQLIS